jgi:hypothetical protein
MNYGYSQPIGNAMARYAAPQQQYQPPMIYGGKGSSGFARYAQGLDRQYGQVQFLKEQGMTDDDIRKLGLDPEMGRGIVGEFGGLLNQRDQLKSDLRNELISGVESGSKYTGSKIATSAKWLGSGL